jgi:hypothetical protein
MPRPEEVLQRESLSPITQRVLRQQPHLRKRVDDDAGRVDAFDLVAQQPHCLAELDLRGAEHRLPIVVALRDIGRHQLANLDAVERPAVGDRDGLQFVEGLGHADVENLFAPVAAGEDELHAQSRFSGARHSIDQVEKAKDEATAEDVVQSRQPGGGSVAPIQRSHSRVVRPRTSRS